MTLALLSLIYSVYSVLRRLRALRSPPRLATFTAVLLMVPLALIAV